MFPSKTRSLKVIFVFICFNKRPATSLVKFFRAWGLLPGKGLTIPAISVLALGSLCSALFPEGALVRWALMLKTIQREVWAAEQEWVSDRGRTKNTEDRVYASTWSKVAEDCGGEESVLAESPLRQQSQCPLWRHQGFCWVVINVYKVLKKSKKTKTKKQKKKQPNTSLPRQRKTKQKPLAICEFRCSKK